MEGGVEGGKVLLQFHCMVETLEENKATRKKFKGIYIQAIGVA